jgi:uncharacterized protein YecE (DUF72 family)
VPQRGKHVFIGRAGNDLRAADKGLPNLRHAGCQSDCISSVMAPVSVVRAQNLSRTEVMIVHVGCSGWFYWGWRGKFYPRELPTHRWFNHYTKHFKTVELNAPFYSWPKKATVRAWIRDAPRAFIYTVKVNRLITHDFRMEGTAMLVEQFYLDVAEPLGQRMGCLLFQFPPSFRYSRTRLRRVLKHLDPRYRNVLEFRHRSWWNGEVYRDVRKAKAIFCTVSAPRLPDRLVVSGGRVYLRLHGVKRWYRYNYSDGELAAWAAKIRGSGAREVWAYFDNDRDANAIKNARTLIRMLKRPPSLAPSRRSPSKTAPKRARPLGSRKARRSKR